MGKLSYQFTIFLLLIWGYSYSQVGFQDSTAYEIENMVISGSLGPVAVDSVLQPVKVFSEKEIRNRGANNLSDLLRQEIQIQQRQDAILGSQTSLNGMGGENMQVLINGIPVLGRTDGYIDLSQILLSQVEKVEIIYGPSAVFYGTNAMAGIINIILKKNVHAPLSLYAKGYYETAGHYNGEVAVSGAAKAHQWGISGGRYFFDGFRNQDSVPRIMSWKPKEQYFAQGRYAFIKKNFTLRSNHQFFNEIIQSKGAPLAPFYINAADQYFTTQRYTGDIHSRLYIKQYHSWDSQISFSWYRRTRNDYFKDLVSLTQTPTDTSRDEFHQVLWRNYYSFSGKISWFRFQGGIEFSWQRAQGPRIKNTIQDIYTAAAFGEATFSLPRAIRIQTGIRYEWNSRFQSIPTPSFQFGWFPNKNFTWKIHYGMGYRTPSLKELYFLFVDINHNIYGNPDLKPETGHAFQSEIIWKKKWNQHGTGFTVRPFWNLIHNQIRNVATSITPDSVIYVYRNVENYSGGGCIASVQYSFHSLMIQPGYGLQFQQNNSLPMAVLHEAYLNVAYGLPKIGGTLSVYTKYSGPQQIVYQLEDESLASTRIQGYWNLDISYTRSFWKNRIWVGIFGKNLLNVRNLAVNGSVSGQPHTEASGSLLQGYGASAGISVSFQWDAKKNEKTN